MLRLAARGALGAVWMLLCAQIAGAVVIPTVDTTTLPGSPSAGDKVWVTDVQAGSCTVAEPGASRRNLCAWSGSAWAFILESAPATGPGAAPSILIDSERVGVSVPGIAAANVKDALSEVAATASGGTPACRIAAGALQLAGIPGQSGTCGDASDGKTATLTDAASPQDCAYPFTGNGTATALTIRSNGAWVCAAAGVDGYTKTELNTSDGDAPNVGSNRVSWNNLTDVPAGFADGNDATATVDRCSGIPNCFKLEDDGDGGGTASDGNVDSEIEAVWNDEILPAFKAGALRVQLDFGDHLGSDWELTRFNVWCDDTDATGGTVPDCDGDSTDLADRRLVISGDARWVANIPKASRVARNSLGSDIALLIGDADADGWDKLLIMSGEIQVRSTDGQELVLGGNCDGQPGTMPVVFEGIRYENLKVIEEQPSDAEMGTCTFVVPQQQLNPGIAFAGGEGPLDLGFITDPTASSTTTAFTFVGPTDLILGGSSAFPPAIGGDGTYKGRDYTPSLTFGPTWHRTGEAGMNQASLSLADFGTIRIMPGAKFESSNDKAPLADITLAPTDYQIGRIGKFIFQGEVSDEKSPNGSLDPAIRMKFLNANLGARFGQDPRFVLDGTFTMMNQDQTGKGILSCGSIAEPPLGGFPIAYLGPQLLLRTVTGGVAGGAHPVGGSSSADGPWPHYFARTGVGMTGPYFCYVRAWGELFPEVKLDYGTATAPVSDNPVDDTGAVAVTLEHPNGISSLPVRLTDAAADFVTAGVCSGDCGSEPFDYLELTSAGGTVDEVGEVRRITAAAATQIDTDGRAWENVVASQADTLSYKVIRPLCFDWFNWGLVSCDDPNSEWPGFATEPHWFFGEHRIRVFAAPGTAVDCRGYWTRDGDPIGDEPTNANNTGSELEWVPSQLGGTSLDEPGETYAAGLTDGFVAGEKLKFRVGDGPTGDCLDGTGRAIGGYTITGHVWPENVEELGQPENCSDGYDNDLDTLIDGDDPDCP